MWHRLQSVFASLMKVQTKVCAASLAYNHSAHRGWDFS
jgi:hypothetical protein